MSGLRFLLWSLADRLAMWAFGPYGTGRLIGELTEELRRQDQRVSSIFGLMADIAREMGVSTDDPARAPLVLVRDVAELADSLGDVRDRLDAQDEAWTTWRQVTLGAAPPRPDLHLIRGGGAS